MYTCEARRRNRATGRRRSGARAGPPPESRPPFEAFPHIRFEGSPLYVSRSLSLSLSLSLYLSIYLYIYLSIYLSTYIYIYRERER